MSKHFEKMKRHKKLDKILCIILSFSYLRIMNDKIIAGWLLMTLALTGCQRQGNVEQGNAVYYWRTDLHTDSTERAFLTHYNINKVYCRYFDVVINDASEGPVPNATLRFSEHFPEGTEVIPTVYITEDCMHQWHEGLAERLVKRIQQMNETNDINHVSEIQIDCDYTIRSLKTYYRFLEAVKKAWGKRLSTTIRLHQLSMKAPPVDYGVLMIYNTGNPQRFDERNPILDIRDVYPYLRHLKDYPLPMAAAYPVFNWLRTIHGVNITHTTDAEEVLKVKKAIEDERPSLAEAIITYHLDKENINRYKPDFYEKIYYH